MTATDAAAAHALLQPPLGATRRRRVSCTTPGDDKRISSLAVSSAESNLRCGAPGVSGGGVALRSCICMCITRCFFSFCAVPLLWANSVCILHPPGQSMPPSSLHNLLKPYQAKFATSCRANQPSLDRSLGVVSLTLLGMEIEGRKRLVALSLALPWSQALLVAKMASPILGAGTVSCALLRREAPKALN